MNSAFTARCQNCNTVCHLPSLKARAVSCDACARKRSAALNEARPFLESTGEAKQRFLDGWAAGEALMGSLLRGLLVALVLTLPPSEATCRMCSPFPCTVSAACGSGCVCLKEGMSLEGRCVSWER